MFSENRFDGAQSTQEVAAPVEKKEALTEPELRQREAELKRRYEDPYRKAQAEMFRNQRNHLRRQEKRRMEELAAQLTNSVTASGELAEGESSQLVRSNEYLSQEVKTLEQQMADLLNQQSKRGLFQKLRYVFAQDPIRVEVESLSQNVAKNRTAIEANHKKIEEIRAKWRAFEEREKSTNERLVAAATESFKEERSTLLGKVRNVNRSSRESIRNTFLSMEEGELDIAKLAKENNAVVVHAIPLDGWSMKNTSMNNKEADIEKLSAKEKVDILLSKQPDISASIIGADKRIVDQEMYYPFGFIVDGKMVASYGYDEGTYAAGDARRRKEEYHGTLQVNTAKEFTSLAHSPAKSGRGGHNESIVHQPTLKGVLIDESLLIDRPDLGDSVTEYFTQDKEKEMIDKYEGKITDTAKGTPTTGPYAGRPVFRLTRERSPVEKAIEYARSNHPELPVYLRRVDGIYTLDGKKVTAEEIYS